jgi:hypothetical protein
VLANFCPSFLPGKGGCSLYVYISQGIMLHLLLRRKEKKLLGFESELKKTFVEAWKPSL